MKMTASVQRWSPYIALGLLATLFGVSIYLAVTRIYQVDEAQNVYSARILASHWERTHSLWVEVWHIWPLAWLASRIPDSVGLFHASRLFMLVIFWLNIIFTAINCGVPWRSKSFLWVLLGAATLAPTWDYGFEIRHDNLLVMLLLMYLYCLRQGNEHHRITSVVLGVLSALQCFVIFKSPVYWFPMAVLFLVRPPETWAISRTKTFLFGCLGFFSTTGIILVLLAFMGRLPFLIDGFTVGFGIASGTALHFSPWGTFTRLMKQSPGLLGLAVAAVISVLTSLYEDWRGICNWRGLFPEVFLITIVLFTLLIHPMPLPYHLCLVVPFAYILGVRWVRSLPKSFAMRSPQAFLWIGLILFTHVTPFLSATLRHLDFTNDRQELLMTLAEKMTDPAKDRVYDAAGLVASRESIGRQWFLHTLFLEQFKRGDLPPVRKMLEERPASILLPNYRFGWLQPDDVAFIRSNYLLLANDFLILGRALQPPNMEFPCLQPGRYYITFGPADPAEIQGGLDLDGVRIPVPSIQTLTTGNHVFNAEKKVAIVVRWLGPNFNQMPTIAPGEPNQLFINWY